MVHGILQVTLYTKAAIQGSTAQGFKASDEYRTGDQDRQPSSTRGCHDDGDGSEKEAKVKGELVLPAPPPL